MRSSSLIAATAAALWTAAFAVGANAQWYDDFDSYALGPLAAQSQWEEWDNLPNRDGEVSNAFAFTGSQSLLIRGDVAGSPGDDIVYDFANLAKGRPVAGTWIFSCYTYVPSTAVGRSSIIMMNDYSLASKNWSLTVQFNATTGKVTNDTGNETLQLIYDQWVGFYALIDLDQDRVDLYYGKQLLGLDQSWMDGISGGGLKQIAALDLYAGEPGQSGTTGTYFDEVRFAPCFGPTTRIHADPNIATTGTTLQFFVNAPSLSPGVRGWAYAWTVNDLFFPYRFAKITLGPGGSWKTSFNIPSGLAGLDISFVAFLFPAGKRSAMSNQEMVSFR